MLGVVVAVGVLVAVLGHIVIDGQITHQNGRNEYLRSHIRELTSRSRRSRTCIRSATGFSIA